LEARRPPDLSFSSESRPACGRQELKRLDFDSSRSNLGLKQVRGQAAVLVVVMLTCLLGMAALVVDAGSWFRSARAAQATADAAALAGAQALPEDPAAARSLAVAYADANGGGLSGSDVTISSSLSADDTIAVSVNRSTPGFFAKLFGIDSVSTPKHASARAGVPAAALDVAPITVNRNHPMLSCSPPPCTGATEIDLADLHKPGSGNAAGAFALLNLDPDDQNGTAGDSTLASWMSEGMDKLMPLGTYYSVPSTMFNGSQFDGALESKYGKEVLFPIYDPPILAGGSNARFRIIGWVGFHITGGDLSGSNGKVFGHFTRYIAHGIQATTGGGADFGVKIIQLVK
jgi:Flp pilus assembly protein TadG